MKIDTVINASVARLAFRGRFEFSCHREFRRAYEGVLAAEGVHEVEVDLADVDYLDSSALGMLLQLNKKCREKNLPVSLLNARGIVADILKIAKFEKIFAIR